MKKVILLLLTAIILLPGCGGKETAEQNMDEKTGKTEYAQQEEIPENDNMPDESVTRAVFAWYGVKRSDKRLFEKYSINTVLLDMNHIEEDIPILESYRVYMLCGDPDWGVDEMSAAVKKAEKAGADGIVFDIENSYPELALNLEKLDTAFPVYCCIPFWLDPMTAEEMKSEMSGHETVDRIVRATDGVFIMNYYKEHERQQISEEMKTCERYHKEIITIYELQPAGVYDLKDQNTYYNEGIAAAENNYRVMFNDTNVGIAFHNLAMMRKLDKRD